MMVKDRQKTLRYRRAVFLQPANGSAVAAETLESYLRRAHRECSTVARRRAQFDGGYILEVRYARRRHNIGTFIHLAAYTEEEPASVVPRATGTEDEAPVSTTPPPRGADFMDGDLLLVVAGNEVLLCGTSLHESRFEHYCASIFNAIDLPPAASMFKLSPVADVDMVVVVENEGVKSISLDATAFSASIERAGRQSIRRNVSDGVQEIVRALFGSDDQLQDVYQRENVSAEIVFKFDKRKKGGEVGQERMAALATQLLDEPTDGFTIKTFGNTTLRHGDITLQKVVKIPANGKTVDRELAFHELAAYYNELKAAGQLDG